MRLFTNNELYEIEKTMDIMAGRIAHEMHKKIQTAIHCGIDDKFKAYNDDLDKQIIGLRRSQEYLQSIRDKCEKLRLSSLAKKLKGGTNK